MADHTYQAVSTEDSLNATDRLPLNPNPKAAAAPAAAPESLPDAPKRAISLTYVYLLIGAAIAVAGILLVLTELHKGEIMTELKVIQGKPVEYKFHVHPIPPRTFQRNRGTCWDFSTIGVLEADYRLNGIEKGYLQHNEYVQFSEQAYGISVMRECEAQGQANCRQFGDFVSENSTDGGEVGWLYYMPNLFKQVLPVSVCPYPWESGHESEHTCPGMDEALKTNPIVFNITEMNTAYEIESTKRLIREKNRALGFSVLTHAVTFHVPCVDAWAARPECAEGKKVRCPENKHFGADFCAELEMPGYNLDGEFYHHGDYILEGGHGMLLVGYNDEYRTKLGLKGGFIIRNSWEDRVYPLMRGPRGSHTMRYFMGELSDWDERTICPNAHAPRSWLSCVNVQMGPTSNDIRRPRFPTRPNRANEDYDLTMCLDSKEMADTVELTRQPMEFVCEDEQWGCSKEASKRYFVFSMVDGPDDTSILTMVEYDTDAKNSTLVAIPPMPTDMLALVFQPVATQKNALKNNDLLCGFYFFPYDTLAVSLSKYPGSYYSTHFQVEWDDASYLINKVRYPKYDYTLLAGSTGTQPCMNFTGPYPFNKRL